MGRYVRMYVCTAYVNAYNVYMLKPHMYQLIVVYMQNYANFNALVYSSSTQYTTCVLPWQ